MREQLSGVDPVGRVTLNQAAPLITCKSNKPMERAKNGARYFRNPPQPHMCIQDFIQDSKEPCYINVLSWIKISTPRRPEDPIPLYGGMKIPCSNAAPVDKKNVHKRQPTIFAVMANPEILRLSGKTAKDPMDRDALVDLMLDFVEAMNPETKFKREFTVLKDRDLTGELKDIWLAIQVKREREKERIENGKKLVTGGREKRKGGRDDGCLRDSDNQQEVKVIDQRKEKEKGTEALPAWFSMEHEQNAKKGNKEGEEPKITVLQSNHVCNKPDQENRNKCIILCEGNKEEEVVISSFKADVRKLGEAAVRQATNTVHTACEVPVTPSRGLKGSPIHQRKSKMRSCKGELFTQTVQHSDEIESTKAGEFHSDVPCVNDINIVTKHTLFKEILPSSSDSSEDEERGEFRLNDLCKVSDNETVNITDSKQIVGVLQDVRTSNLSRNFDDRSIGVRSNDPGKSENISDSDLEPDIPQKAICLEEACSYGSTDLRGSNVHPCKFVCMKYSGV